MVIVNQDRDKYLSYEQTQDILQIQEVSYHGMPTGYNIMLNGTLLGTFDDSEEAKEEAARITSFKGDVYYISGYEPFEKFNTIFSKILELVKQS